MMEQFRALERPRRQIEFSVATTGST